MRLNILIDTLDSIAACTEPADKWRACTEAFGKLGSSFLSIAQINLPTGEIEMLQTTMRPEWVGRWVDKEYASVDPHLPKEGVAPSQLQRTVWRSSDMSWAGQAPDREQTRYHKDLIEAGYDAVVGIPCPMGDTLNVRVVVGGADRGKEQFLDGDALQSLILMAPFVALSAPPLEACDPQLIVDRRPKLSARERDVLCLLANGLLNARIAEKLGISEPMVRKHLVSARRKLGCATREQAVAEAITRRLITP